MNEQPVRARTSGIARLVAGVAVLAGVVVGAWSEPVRAQAPAKAKETESSGQFFTLVEPFGDQKLRELRTAVSTYLTRQATRPTADGHPVAAPAAQRPILVFEFQAAADASETTSFGAASDLARYIETGLGGVRKTVAYVPGPLEGFAVIPVLACDEIVMGPDASLGPIMPPGQVSGEREQAVLRELARSKGRETDLLLGLLDSSRDLREVRTPDATHYVLAENLDAFKRDQTVVEERSAWDSRRGVLGAESARKTIVGLLASSRDELATVYRLPSTATDPTLLGAASALVIPIKGAVTTLSESYILRQIARLPSEKVNVVVFDIDSEGGLYEEADKIAKAIAGLEGIRTIALVDERALGVAALIPLACDEIALTPHAKMGDVRRQIVDRSGTVEEFDERLTDILGERAEELAQEKGRSGAVARAMVDPSAVVERARDKQTGAVRYVLGEDVKADPERYEVLETLKSADQPALLLDPTTASALRISDRTVEDMAELAAVHGLRSEQLRLARRTWVDSLVDTLNSPWARGMLLFLGFSLLLLEVKLPGIGLPAILSGLAFLLYFWSSYLGGTADRLEILLFVVGLLCIGLELFVFPGFGVFGMSGVLLVLASVVMASLTFALPTQEYEYRQLAATLLRLLGALVGVIVGAMVMSRYLPSMPIFHRLVLQPVDPNAPMDPTIKPVLDGDAPLTYLLGEVGRTTTVLRPSGRARFGDLLVDVTADSFWVDPGEKVEVIEVRGSRVLVRRVS
jgi:membrane-bound serine protease (ClpP class)